MFLFLVGLACLFPLSLYCLYSAMLHQRRRPTMISGPWDFAGVLIALSGFLLVGGSTLVFTLHGAARDWLLRGDSWRDFADIQSRESRLAWLIWGGYVLVLVGGAVRELRLRRKMLSLYNIDPEELGNLLNGLFDRLRLPWQRLGNRWTIGSEEQPRAVFEIDGSEAMRQVSLRWLSAASDSVRAELEAELARELTTCSCPESRTSGWFLTAGGAIFTIMIFLLATFLMVMFRM